MNKQIAIVTMLTCTLAAGATAALAQSQDEQQACTNDAFQFCQNAIPDRNRVFACLMENRRVISRPCQVIMAQYLPPDPPPPAPKKPPAKKPAPKKGPLQLTPQ
jgi:hypothetical protein